MKDDINQILESAVSFKIENASDLENFRLQFLVKKGLVNDLLTKFRELDGAGKKEFGKDVNVAKSKVEAIYNSKKEELDNSSQKKADFNNDLPGYFSELGSRHPISKVIEDMSLIFGRLGFSVANGPEIEDDWHNFSALNFPENHPARDMQDTFFIDKDIALRTHTSSVQVRLMENGNLPIRSIMPGRVYRNEAISARSNCFFHQVEGLYIDEGVSFADLKQTLYQFVQDFFGENTKVRFRASYFPFTEPSAEMDIYLGKETESDYRLTKGTGWLEILGCGMVDPNVLENCNIDSNKYSGFAFGLGVDRIAMLKYGVKDLRTFFNNDKRFLDQFAAL
jgi:phenylalanyl-tRNA synthetase alpha chain